MAKAFIVPDVEQELTKFGIADAAIAKMAEDYLPLTIDGLKDRAGYDRVHDARMIVRNKRTKIEAVRKDLKADALEYGRKVDAEAKRLTALLEPIENHLLEQETAIDKERERLRNAEIEAARLKAEAEEKARRDAEEAALQAEKDRLAAERAELEAEKKRQAEAEAKRQAEVKAEQDRIAAEQKAEADRLAAIARKQREEQEAIEAEKRRIAEEEAAKARAAETERLQKEAAEKARKETEARLKREAEEKERKRIEDEKKAAARAAKLEAAKPDVEKIRALGSLLRSVPMPAVKGGEATAFLIELHEQIVELAKRCEEYQATA